MNRVLHIVGKMNRGGQETFIMNLFRSINRENVMFDFVVSTDEKGDYDNEICNLGGKIYHVTPKSKNIFRNYKQIKQIVKKNKYYIVERHTSNSYVFIDLFAAKRGGAKTRIAHSHNTSDNHSFIHRLCQPLLNKYTTARFACSTEAGEWLFGKKSFEIISNAIDIKNYVYSPEIRAKQRKLLDINDNQFVIGTVGRLNKQKNPKFILDIFYQIYLKEPNSIFIWIGVGELEGVIKEKIRSLNLQDHVKMLGLKNNVSELYQAMDAFLLPSLFEGLPVVGIEAQASGLPCFISDTVTDEIEVTDLVQFISFDKKATYWAEKVLEAKQVKRKNMLENIKKANYDINKLAKKNRKFLFKK